jgi:hypothetical protein
MLKGVAALPWSGSASWLPGFQIQNRTPPKIVVTWARRFVSRATPDGRSTFTPHAMNPRLFLPALLAASLASAQPAAPGAAPAKADNPPAAADGKTEMQKWIEATDAQWQAVFKRDVTEVREAELNKVKLQYTTALEDGIKKASSANDLKGALALRNEQKRFGDTQTFPENDEDAGAPALKAVRAALRVELGQLELRHAGRAKALHAKYDPVLAQAQTQLTKAQRLDDAQLVQTKRDEVKTAWLAGIPEAPAAAIAEPPAARAALTATKAGPADHNLFKNPNFENGTDHWELLAFGKEARMTVDQKERHNGKPSLRIDNPEGSLSFVKQMVAGKPDTHYQLSGYIMTKDVEPVKEGSKAGACLMVGFSAEVRVGQTQSKARGGKSASIQKTNQWTKIAVDFTTGSKTALPVGAAMGYYTEDVKGTAWFSELSLVELGSGAKK